MLNEFKKFIMRGNVIDLAIGIIIGTAFKDIVNSLVNDIIMPPIGLILGGVDFSDIFILLGGAPENLTVLSVEQAAELGIPTINVGVFLNTLIEFLIIAAAVFFLIRAMNNLMDRMARGEEPEAAPPLPTTEEKLLEAIQDLTVAIKSQDSE